MTLTPRVLMGDSEENGTDGWPSVQCAENAKMCCLLEYMLLKYSNMSY